MYRRLLPPGHINYRYEIEQRKKENRLLGNFLDWGIRNNGNKDTVKEELNSTNYFNDNYRYYPNRKNYAEKRSVSCGDITTNDPEVNRSNNYNNVYYETSETKYNPYSRFGPKRYEPRRIVFNEKKHFDKDNKCNFYYNNSKNALRKSQFSNYKPEHYHMEFPTIEPIEKVRNLEYEYNPYKNVRNVPIYEQRAVELNIQPNRNRSVDNVRKVYSSERGNGDRSRFGDRVYNYYLNEPMRGDRNENWKEPPLYYYYPKYDRSRGVYYNY